MRNVSSNEAQITLHHNYSGSGPDAFNNCSTWPHLKVEMGFPGGTESDLPGLAAKLAAVVDEFLTSKE